MIAESRRTELSYVFQFGIVTVEDSAKIIRSTAMDDDER
jgi:hypothetical protein